jgi:hypothetical protein
VTTVLEDPFAEEAWAEAAASIDLVRMTAVVETVTTVAATVWAALDGETAPAELLEVPVRRSRDEA